MGVRVPLLALRFAPCSDAVAARRLRPLRGRRVTLGAAGDGARSGAIGAVGRRVPLLALLGCRRCAPAAPAARSRRPAVSPLREG